MKKVLLTMVVLLISTLLVPNAFARINRVGGGISGGGGYVINPLRPTTPQSAKAVEHMIKKSKPLLFNYILNKKNQMKNMKMSGDEHQIYERLFKTTEPSFERVIKQYKIHIENEEPCFTSDNIPVDGSIFSESEQSICISSATIAEKVHHTEVTRQSAALILHEMVEFVGLSEEEAVHLQKIAIDEIK
jgi:hypothetical protein